MGMMGPCNCSQVVGMAETLAIELGTEAVVFESGRERIENAE